MKARHIRTGGVYVVLDLDAHVRRPDGEWLPGMVVYTCTGWLGGRGSQRFIRTREEFDAAFEVLAPWPKRLVRWLRGAS